MRLSSFFRHCETDFFSEFFYCSSHQFLIFCNRIDATFFGTMRLTGNFKKISKKNSEIFFSIISFSRAFVVSSCRKSGFRFRVFLSLRYGADLGRSRLVFSSDYNPHTDRSTFLTILTILKSYNPYLANLKYLRSSIFTSS